ncbi:hypothetical protein P175DRAFT_089843 [Aspergillus ochraceoroseus IBT 24754]|uniref:Uncharacterized protein n=1 Tax=Aspergillus ochraceoroseus IBT 24754 TaxID=1392256 RepID=A0A2T5LME4_9EURO|nr:uncharacterized protein P175DRAFT_089843 [Aspergillus ochraceoroseus IBT 24754]PTU17454.1 hypothetical protein P175DRAFT_089843 [Aspergillus ochraceoroseus IBT 24754]
MGDAVGVSYNDGSIFFSLSLSLSFSLFFYSFFFCFMCQPTIPCLYFLHYDSPPPPLFASDACIRLSCLAWFCCYSCSLEGVWDCMICALVRVARIQYVRKEGRKEGSFVFFFLFFIFKLDDVHILQ